MSTPGWFDTRLSIGNIITIVVVLFGVAAGWFGFDNRLTLAEVELRRTANVVERLERERTDLTTRVTRIEERLASQSEMLQRILRNTESEGWRRRDN